MKIMSKLIIAAAVFFGLSEISCAQCPEICDDNNKNTALGNRALQSNTTGSSNTALGWSALQANTNGHDNTAVGQGALYYDTSGDSNTGRR